MNDFPHTIIIRHKKENLKKCSLRGLETRKDFLFYSYPSVLKLGFPKIENYILLTLDAEKELSYNDHNSGILLVDATWRLADIMLRKIPFPASLIKRRLPSSFQTAYPRRQNDCKEPTSGLASIEALFIAYMILKRNSMGILEQYYWKNEFLQKNQKAFHFPTDMV